MYGHGILKRRDSLTGSLTRATEAIPYSLVRLAEYGATPKGTELIDRKAAEGNSLAFGAFHLGLLCSQSSWERLVLVTSILQQRELKGTNAHA